MVAGHGAGSAIDGAPALSWLSSSLTVKFRQPELGKLQAGACALRGPMAGWTDFKAVLLNAL